ncbi:hypothetical protein GF336_00550 [Candidatus Woesearchaeota archaeon]|nr:hypothetical protein [Candidatus Woesearchaeota archaeon]
MKRLEFKIGNIELFKDHAEFDKNYCHWKFISVKEDSSILFYAGLKKNRYKHKDIVEANSLDESQVLGGGFMNYCFGDLQFDDFSQDFGYVPNSAVIEFVKPVYDFLKDKLSPIENVIIDMKYDADNIDGKFLEKMEQWKNMDYGFDNKKRTIDISEL